MAALVKMGRSTKHKVAGLCIPAFIADTFIVFGPMVVVYVLHLFLPGSWRWLGDKEIEHLHNIVFGAAA